MKKALKDAKWWMFLPFACCTMKMSRWTLEPEYKERVHRYTFQVINVLATIVVIAFTMGALGVFK